MDINELTDDELRALVREISRRDKEEQEKRQMVRQLFGESNAVVVPPEKAFGDEYKGTEG